MSSGDRPTRVFISYSHDSEEHGERVLELANRLRSEGVDAWLDRYEQAPEEGWPRWMQRQLEEADFVIVVCTETYKRRFDGKEESRKGKGATWEGLLAMQVVYEAGSINSKLLPIVFGDAGESAIPLSLRPFTFWRLPSQYTELYGVLTAQPDVPVPPIGEEIQLPSDARCPPVAELPSVSAGLPPPEREPKVMLELAAEIAKLRRVLESQTPTQPENPTPFTRAWLWKVLDQRLGRRWALISFSAILLAGAIAIEWSTISGWPPVAWVLRELTQDELPKPKPGVFNLGYTHLVDDPNRTQEKRLRIALQKVPQLEGIPSTEPALFDREIRVSAASVTDGLQKAHEEARNLLKQSGFDALIWGEVVEGPPSQFQLHWTSAGGRALDRSPDLLPPTSDPTFPPLFLTELQDVVNLVATTSAARILGDEEGHFTADRLSPLVERMRVLAQEIPTTRSAETTAELKIVFADALCSLGEQSGRNDYLAEAIALYGDVLKERTRERAPPQWAATQNSIGNALLTLGERESNTDRIRDAAAAYREALKEYSRERVPLAWAMTQNNLGNALATLGQRESGTERVEEAVIAYREALKEYTRERVPLAWAATQNNLGNALTTLGRRESGSDRLEEAVVAYRDALKERTRERVPLKWATTQNNLGTALGTLGKREPGTKRLEEAVAAYREALKEWTRERVPLDWATAQNNLGTSLTTLGDRESATERLQEAVVAYREALKERTRERVPLDWAMTQNNLGNALMILGDREEGTKRLEEAVVAYRDALSEYTRERVPLEWAATQDNLGNALGALGKREPGTKRFEEAVAAYHEALKERTRERVPLDWATTQNNLGTSLHSLGARGSGTTGHEQAVAAYREALKERTRERVPLDWATTQLNLGMTLLTIGQRESRPEPLQEAWTCFTEALDVFKLETSPRLYELTRSKITRAEKLLSQLH